MTQVRALMLAAASVSALCGTPATAQSDITIALVLGERGSGFHQAIACGARAKAEELGINVEIQAAPRYAASEQIPLLASMLATAPDAIVLDPTSSTALIAPLREAVEAGTIVVAVDTTLDDPSFLTAEIGTDNVEVGREAALALVALLDGREGKVAMVNAIPGISTVDQRIEGFEAEIALHPGLEYIGNQFATEDVSLAQAAFTALVSAHPDLIGVAALSNTPAIGVAGGIRSAGLAEDVVAVGVDADETEIAALREGLLDALVIQQPVVMGSDGVQQAYNALTGAPVETPIGTGNITATRDNLDTPDVQQYLYEGDCI
jgi:ribose transport system substrate-binding protein